MRSPHSTDYVKFREGLLSEIETRGCIIQPPQPLAHPELATNFTMSLAATLLTMDLPREQSRCDYGVIQPCLRIHDSAQVLADSVPWHLTFFEMAGAVVDGFDPRLKAFTLLFGICESLLRMEPNSLVFQIFSGNGPFAQPGDSRTEKSLLSLGVSDRQFRYSEESYFGKRAGEKVAGPLVEVFVTSRNGELRELATVVFLDKLKSAPGTLTDAPVPVAEIGMGVERAYSVARNEFDLANCEPLSPVIEALSAFPPDARLMVADRLRAATFAISEGVLPGPKGRRYIVRRLLRDIFQWELGQPGLDQICQAVAKIVETSRQSYPHLAAERVYQAVQLEHRHETERRAGKKF